MNIHVNAPQLRKSSRLHIADSYSAVFKYAAFCSGEMSPSTRQSHVSDGFIQDPGLSDLEVMPPIRRTVQLGLRILLALCHVAQKPVQLPGMTTHTAFSVNYKV